MKMALKDYLPNVFNLSEASTADEVCRLSQETSNTIFGQHIPSSNKEKTNRISFSATSFEKYVQCPFSYYCSNVLKLRENKTAKFHSNIIGTFVHHILEELLKESIPSKGDLQIPEDDVLISNVEKCISEYIDKIYPAELGKTKKFNHLCLRLKSLSLLIIRNIVEEFSHSQFRPTFFELKADGKNGHPQPMKFTLEHGGEVSFSGVIDRVDIYKHEGNVYVRVIDYKTGDKEFSLDDIRRGINTQMLLYLFAICRTDNISFKKSIGIDEGANAIPAGAIYLSAKIPTINAETYEEQDKVLLSAEKKLNRSGIILNEEDILLAMNDTLSPDFLAGIRKNKDGIINGSALTSSENFEKIFEQMKDTILKIADEAICGVAYAVPMKLDKNYSCKYCNMKPICRKNIN